MHTPTSLLALAGRSHAVVWLGLGLACSPLGSDPLADTATDGTADTGDSASSGSTGHTGTEPAIHGPLTVIAAHGGRPVVGVQVLFHDPAGAVLGAQTTDGAGRATWSDFERGGAVTVATATETGRRLGTLMALEPGAEVVVDDAPRLAEVPDVRLVVDVAPWGEASTYWIDAGCGEVPVPAGDPVEVSIDGRCLRADGSLQILALVRQSVTGERLAHALHDGVLPGATLPIPSWTSSRSAVDVHLTDLATTTQAVAVSSLEVHGGWAYLQGEASGLVEDPGALQTVRLEGLTDALDLAGIHVVATHDTPAASSAAFFVAGYDALPRSITLGPAQVGNRVVETAFEPTRAEVTWALEDALWEADGVVAQIVWAGAPGTTWLVHAPVPSGSVLALPDLGELSAWLPGAEDAVPPTLIFFDDSRHDGSADQRTALLPGWLADDVYGPGAFELRVLVGGGAGT